MGGRSHRPPYQRYALRHLTYQKVLTLPSKAAMTWTVCSFAGLFAVMSFYGGPTMTTSRMVALLMYTGLVLLTQNLANV